jgi:hypothetical protein
MEPPPRPEAPWLLDRGALWIGHYIEMGDEPFTDQPPWCHLTH